MERIEAGARKPLVDSDWGFIFFTFRDPPFENFSEKRRKIRNERSDE